MNKIYGVEESFPRSAEKPEAAEVKDWPFPSPPSLQGESSKIIKLADMNKGEPSPDIMGLDERFNRPAKAPTTSEVGHFWPLAYAQKKNEDNDIANVPHVSPGVYKVVNDNTTPLNEMKRSAGPPTSAEVANWPYPSYSQTKGPNGIENTPHINPLTSTE